ncbi:MAG TPA: PQQ-dependent sugar dehydrogenase [Burkholderiales bacterium]|nr:PQQ-dependent sugar dehydrogenase [Burkholderiales bacterium]
MKTQGATESYRAALFGAALLLLAACGPSGDSVGGAPRAPQNDPPALAAERVFPGLSFEQPVAMLQAPADGTRWFVVEQTGRVRVFANIASVATFDTFVDISSKVTNVDEMGLLGMAFHPNFPTDPRVYLSYVNEGMAGRFSFISEFTLLGPGGNLNPASEQVLLRIAQPEANHNGGQIAFGAHDGLLYIGMGDGGGANDQHLPIGNGQRMTTVLGKMLRIDVSPATGYAIPFGNPFANSPQLCGTVSAGGTGPAPCPEIYASGFRNPWRWSFDRITTALWVGDVGQNAIEEIDRVTLGGNFGWRCFEGTRPTGLGCGSEPGLLPPVAEYGRTEGSAVTGGYVYRGSAIADLQGRYVFGDFGSGTLWHIAADTPPTRLMGAGFATGLSIASFAEDVLGELFIVDYGGGLYRVRLRP